MVLWNGPGGMGGFGYSCGNALTTRPAATAGTAVTPGNNTYGSSAQLIAGASVLEDLYGLHICFQANSTAAAARDTLATIGVDPAGGTSYTDLIPHLLASCAGSMVVVGGVYYYFPIWVRAGSSIGCKGSVNNATVETFQCIIRGFGRPRDARNVRVGSYVEAIGAVTANSAGTAVTPGTTSEGAWTSLGAVAKASWWFQQGMGVNDPSMTALCYAMDCAFGDATNKHILIEDEPVTTANTESLAKPVSIGMQHQDIPAGTNIYGRLQCSGVADANTSQIVYALGG